MGHDRGQRCGAGRTQTARIDGHRPAVAASKVEVEHCCPRKATTMVCMTDLHHQPVNKDVPKPKHGAEPNVEHRRFRPPQTAPGHWGVFYSVAPASTLWLA